MAAVKVSRGQPPIDRGWAWMVCLGFFLFVFFMVGLAKSFGLILVALIKEFDVSTATAALPISVTLSVYAFGAPIAILVAENFSIQKVVIVGAIIGFFGFAVSSLLFNMAYFIMTFGIFYGIGNSCFYGNGMIMIGRYFKIRRSLANGLALSGASIGQLALPPLIEYLLENYGLNGTLLLMASFYLHGAISGFLFRPIDQYDAIVVETKPEAVMDEEKLILKAVTDKDEQYKMNDYRNGRRDEKKLLSGHMGEKNHENSLNDQHTMKGGGDEKINSDGCYRDFDADDASGSYSKQLIIGSQGSVFIATNSTPNLANTDEKSVTSSQDNGGGKCSNNILCKVIDFSLLRNRITIFFTIVSFLCFFGYFNFILFLPSIVIEKGIEDYDKAFLISICGGGDLIARISVGFFADLNIIARYKIKAIACMLCACNIFMFVFADSFSWLAVHCFLYGFLGGAYVCMIAVVLVDFVGLVDMGRNLAVVLFIQGIGSSAGNPLLGYLKDATGSFVIVTVVCALSLGIGAILLFFYPVFRHLEAKRTAHNYT